MYSLYLSGRFGFNPAYVDFVNYGNKIIISWIDSNKQSFLTNGKNISLSLPPSLSSLFASFSFSLEKFSLRIFVSLFSYRILPVMFSLSLFILMVVFVFLLLLALITLLPDPSLFHCFCFTSFSWKLKFLSFSFHVILCVLDLCPFCQTR